MNGRALTPLGWAVLLVAALVLLALVGAGLGLRWDPLQLGARRLARAEAGAAAARADAAARALEIEGRDDQAVRLEDFHQQAAAVERTTARAVALARSAPDATLSLDPARAARLVEHDRQLCRLAADVCGPASSGSADGGDDPLPAGSVGG